MTTPVIALFNNKGGVGKTSLVYHLSWMFADNEWRVIAADLDPQANLTAAFLTDEALEELWNRPDRGSVLGAVAPLLRGVGDVLDEPPIQRLAESLWLLPGDLVLSKFEDELSQQWIQCLAGNERAFRVISAFWRLVQNAAATVAADVALVDLGPNLGAINRAALIAADHVVVPLAPDLFSLQGLQNLGPALRGWRGAK